MKIKGSIMLLKQDLDAIEQIIKYIGENFSKPITAESLSEMYSIRIPELHKGIKKKTNQNLHNYITTIRIKKAQEALIHDVTTPIKAIAHNVGYKTANHFGSVFKKLVGQTPQSYRLSHLPLHENM